MSHRDNLFDALRRIIMCRDVDEKCKLTEALPAQYNEHKFVTSGNDTPEAISTPGLPENLELVSPRHLKRRGMSDQSGRNVLMHAIAHIEFNAINLALDAAYRFRSQPRQYYLDWIGVATDEARHFEMVREYLVANNCDYGEFPAHSGLWDMALETAHDVLARMALVPRVMEARGLDVTPGMIQRLERAGDKQAATILRKIYEEEIGHVKIGSKWFNHHCRLRGLEPGPTFFSLVKNYFHGELRGPFNLEARTAAGFSEEERLYLTGQLN